MAPNDPLDSILAWTQAYPADMFEPLSSEHYAAIRKILSANGYSLDALSADIMRHLIHGIRNLALAAINSNERPKP